MTRQGWMKINFSCAIFRRGLSATHVVLGGVCDPCSRGSHSVLFMSQSTYDSIQFFICHCQNNMVINNNDMLFVSIQYNTKCSQCQKCTVASISWEAQQSSEYSVHWMYVTITCRAKNIAAKRVQWSSPKDWFCSYNSRNCDIFQFYTAMWCICVTKINVQYEICCIRVWWVLTLCNDSFITLYYTVYDNYERTAANYFRILEMFDTWLRQTIMRGAATIIGGNGTNLFIQN